MRLIILGAGGYGRTVADIAEQTGTFESIGFLDDRSQAEDVLGSCEQFQSFQDGQTAFYPAFGNNQSRIIWINRLMESGCEVPTFVHPRAYVSPKAVISSGCVIMPLAVVNTGCEVKQGCIVNCGAIVDHGCILEEGVHVCLGAIVKAENRIPRLMKIEAEQVVSNRTYPV